MYTHDPISGITTFSQEVLDLRAFHLKPPKNKQSASMITNTQNKLYYLLVIQLAEHKENF